LRWVRFCCGVELCNRKIIALARIDGVSENCVVSFSEEGFKIE
jgi:hypothetical protein